MAAISDARGVNWHKRAKPPIPNITNTTTRVYLHASCAKFLKLTPNAPCLIWLLVNGMLKSFCTLCTHAFRGCLERRYKGQVLFREQTGVLWIFSARIRGLYRKKISARPLSLRVSRETARISRWLLSMFSDIVPDGRTEMQSSRDAGFRFTTHIVIKFGKKYNKFYNFRYSSPKYKDPPFVKFAKIIKILRGIVNIFRRME